MVIPTRLVREKAIGADEAVTISIERGRPPAGVLFGRFPRLKRWTTQELKDEARAGWEGGAAKEGWK